MAKDETPLQEKQYYVLVTYKPEKWKKGEIISIPQEVAQAYIGSKIITPLRTALASGQYVPKIEIATYVKPKPVPRSSTTAEEPIKKAKPKKKTLIKNSLRTAVQEKKEAATEPEDEPTEESVDQPTPSSSAAEDAIKKKIAAAKKTKKK